MNYLLDLYYGLWAQISVWPRLARAALVLSVLLLIIWIVLVIILPKILMLIFVVLKALNKASYIIFSDYIFPLFFRKNYIYIVNGFSNFMEKCCNSLNKIKQRLKQRKLHLVKFIILYGLALLLIVLPNMLSSVISPEYLNVISYVSVAYNDFESEQLQYAEAYNPIIILDDDSSADDNEKFEKMYVIQSVNFREGPGTSYDSIKVLMENTIVYFIEKNEDGKWFHVKTEDGLEGWVHNKYVN